MYLYLGGEKSGKSALALQTLLQGPAPACLLATGRPLDASFRRQVNEHRLSRPTDLPVLETGVDLVGGIFQTLEQGYKSLLVDSLDFWLFACLDSGNDHLAEQFGNEAAQFNRTATEQGAVLGFVSCEVSLGPVAADACTRRFVRELGALHQTLAQACDTVCLVVAGLPLYLKKGQHGIFPQA